MSRRLATAVLVLGATLAGCAPLPTDDGRSATAELLAARGQQPPTAGDDTVASLLARLREQPLSAADAVRLALLNNPDMKAEYAGLGFAAADVYRVAKATTAHTRQHRRIQHEATSPIAVLTDDIDPRPG